MLLAQLTKLARSGERLRKQAGLVGGTLSAAGSAVKGVAGWGVNNPGKALIGGLGAYGGGMATKGAFKQHKAGFDPGAQSALMGEVPKPVGVP